MAHKPTDGIVLNTIQPAAGDIVLAGGRLQLNNTLSEALKIADGTSLVKTAYAAGTAQEDDVDYAAATLAANSQYRISVEFSDLRDASFNNVQVIEDGGRSEANELVPVREYVVWTGTAVPTAGDVRDLFIARINGDNGARVTASIGGAGIVTLTMDDVTDGSMVVTASSGATVANVVAFVAPAGTPAIVDADFPGQSSPAANYTTWTINFINFRRSNVVSGAVVGYPEYMTIYADALATNFVAFATELDDVLDGTHTPASDYLGI